MAFLTIVIANAISFHIGNSSNIKLTSLFEMFEANAEEGNCYMCTSYSTECIGGECAPELEMTHWLKFTYVMVCESDPNGNSEEDISCTQSGEIDCDGETCFDINTCDDL